MTGDAQAAGAELLAAAEEIIAAGAAAGATVRLLGGVAVFQLAPSVRTAPLARPYHDYDVVVPSRHRAATARVFRAAGYSEDQHFNALHGAQRMIFAAPLAGDWGFYHTVERNLPKVVECARARLGGDQAQAVAVSAGLLRQAMEAAPKSVRWKMRARAGEKVTWYELPEETG